METIRVRNNPIHSTIIDEDIFFVDDYTNGNDSHCQAIHLKQYILNGKTIGGSGNGDIVDNDSIQTLKNKRLDNPKINSNIELVTTSTELNRFHNIDITPDDLSALHEYSNKLSTLSDLSTSKTLQTQIDNIKEMAESNNYRLYYKNFLADNTSKAFNFETILNELNIDKDKYYIIPGSLIVQICMIDKINHKFIIHGIGEGENHSCFYEEDENIIYNKYYFKELNIGNLISNNWYSIKIFFKLGLW